MKNILTILLLLVGISAINAQNGIGEGFDPENPANPGRNYFNAATGELIIDDFEPGKIMEAVDEVIGNSNNRPEVLQATVIGKMKSNDMYLIGRELKACTLFDFSRTNGYDEVPTSAFKESSAVSIILPECIKEIGSSAFADCGKLTEMTVLAVTPPTVNDENAFSGVPEGLVVRVMSRSLPLYAEADVWKNFTLLPLDNEVHSLEVALPENAADGRYNGMSIELVNTESGQTQKQVVTDRLTYTFYGLLAGSTYNVYLKNTSGETLAIIENIMIEDEDVKVAFGEIIETKDVTLTVLTPEGTDVTAQTEVEWTDADGKFVASDPTVQGIIVGTELYYKVTIDQSLGMEYKEPGTHILVVGEQNEISLTLERIGQVMLSGTVKDEDGQPIHRATVTVTQNLNGKYPKSLMTTTEADGSFSLYVYCEDAAVSVSSDDYITETLTVSGLTEAKDLGDIILEKITGARIGLNLTFTPSVAEGETAETQDWYEDYENIEYSLYNNTARKEIEKFSVQYPTIVLTEASSPGDILTITASSKKGAFKPVTADATPIDTLNYAEVTIPIVELGGIRASFSSTDNTDVVGLLYNADGQLMKKYAYADASLEITGLQDGRYTLVTMTGSDMFNSILNLSQFAASGLAEGTDYVKNDVDVKSGVIAVVSNDMIPVFDESKLYYTGDNTSFTVNKTSIVIGNYLTLKAKIDFKDEYASGVSGVSLVVDLPTSCSFVENSVMVGTDIAVYSLEGSRLTIPVSDISDDIRFSVIPTESGTYSPGAFARFTLDGEEILQPIGNVSYEAKDLSIDVPPTTANKSITVGGTATGNSEISIYDNGTLIGQTTSLANGSWTAECELNEPYNLSRHGIYAEITTSQGIKMQSETKECVYDLNAIQVTKVTMYYNNPELNNWNGKNYEIVFDFLNPNESSKQYVYYIHNKTFTFTIEFNHNDTTRVSNVVLYVKTGKGKQVPLQAEFDVNKQLWVTTGDFGNYYDGDIPVNVSVDFDTPASTDDMYVDRDLINSTKESLEELLKESIQTEEEIRIAFNAEVKADDSIQKELEALFSSEDYTSEQLYEIIKKVTDQTEVNNDTISSEEAQQLVSQLTDEYESWLSDFNNEKDSILNELFDSSCYDKDTYTITTATHEIIHSYKKQVEYSEEELLQDGFSYYSLTDISKVFYKYTTDSIVIVDMGTKEMYSIIMREHLNNTSNIKSNNSSKVSSSYKVCAERITTIFADITELYEYNKNDLSDEIKLEIISLFKDMLSSIDCYYEGLRYDVKKGINEQIKNINKKIAQIDLDVNARMNQIKMHEDRIICFSQKIKDNKNKLEIETDPEWIKFYKNDIKAYEKSLIVETSYVKDLNRQIGKLKLAKSGFEISKNTFEAGLKEIDEKVINLQPNKKLATTITAIGKIAGTIGTLFDIYCLWQDISEFITEHKGWEVLKDGIDRKIPCEGNEQNAKSLQSRIYKDADVMFNWAMSVIIAEITAIGFDLAGGIPLTLQWGFSSFATGYAEWIKFLKGKEYLNRHSHYWLDIMNLKCGTKDDDKKEQPKANGGEHNSGSADLSALIDPSGYVYEAVSSNRLEGVKATCYYKEGESGTGVVWNAADYAQENPLFTDENGMYRWDVPQGLWQVRFEKEGYQVTQSEWLPVPPPQLEVNIAMTQTGAPEVKAAHAYEDGIDVEFSKYMMPEDMTTDNIFATVDGKKIEGTIEMKDEERAYEDDEDTYVSKVRFTPLTKFTAGDEVTLSVSRRVRSYAGTQMAADFSQQFDIVKEVKRIAADSIIQVQYNGGKRLTVSVVPFDAAVGMTLKARSASEMIATVTPEAVIDENGQATLDLKGELPGVTAMTFTIDGIDARAVSTVRVVTGTDGNVTATPQASHMSGTDVYKGTAVTLTCDDKGAVIYYTTDGSCPCDEQGRRLYTEPITIDADMTIKAVAVADGKEESDVAEFAYRLKRAATAMKLHKGWNWLSHNLDTIVSAELIAGGETETFISCDGTTTDATPASASYKAKVGTDRSYTLQGIQINPADVVINLREGWNWIGYPLGQTLTVSEAMQTAQPDEYDCIVGQEGFAQFAGGKWQGSLKAMRPGQGYMYMSGSSKAFTYFSGTVSKAQSLFPRNAARQQGAWTTDVYAYADMMCVIAELYDDGAKTADGRYTVGAFCGAECRSVGKYEEGKLWLNVIGKAGDEIRFMAYDNESGLTYHVKETLTFGVVVEGSADLPYAMHLGDEATGIEEVTHSGDMKARISDGKLYVTFGGDIDYVTLHSADGVCVFKSAWGAATRYKDVSWLPTGVYVLSVSSNGKTHYAKLTNMK